MPLYRNGSREESMMHDTLMVTILPFLGATISLLLWSLLVRRFLITDSVSA